MLDLNDGFSAYKSTSVDGRAASADIHKLVLMLFDGFLDELERVTGHINQKRYDKKAESIEKMMRILGGLEASLDLEKGGEVAGNMRNLYEHCGQSLLQASLKNDLIHLDSVRTVMTNLQEGWKGLGSQVA
ncbi:flagellar export chaperone FliS [Pseudoalteromonas shioyasakiensis]|uniref:flagellar export chaperone FliS n=1 Tax=Pseudoalteromonas shioyasakiensis TaxID=1190813 RepID=UPI002118526F|nr:flagellar export chaperone FliS [Pseudoalteromonas shioyasakiensis]MCQ8877504.1 flagellar export chaperone FliS [Pseudoalteromonas shioyasakiensis]